MPFQIFEKRDEGSLSNRLKWIDGNVEKISLIDPTPDFAPGLAKIIDVYTAGRPIKDDGVPTKCNSLAGDDQIYDFYMGVGGLIVVSGAFRKFVEAIEPSIHQFFEVDVLKGTDLIRKMNILVVCQRLDTIDHDRSTFRFVNNYAWVPWDENDEYSAEAKIACDKEKIGNSHLWIEKHLIDQKLFVSDELGDALIAASITGLGTQYTELVG